MTSEVKDYLNLVHSLEREQFVERFSHPFLIRRSDQQSLAPREEYSSTLKMRIDKKTHEYKVEPQPPSPLDVVLEVQKSDRNSFASKVLVGRTETNDLVVSHMTVSKHHAFFSTDEGSGRTILTDTGSTNGSQVNGLALAPRDPSSLEDGDRVSFGDIEFEFYSPNGFFDLLRSLPALR